MKTADLLSLDRQYTFYRSYHQNRKNRIIHILTVPILVQSFLVIMSLLVTLPQSLLGDVSMYILTLYTLYCLYLDFYVGLSIAPYMLLLYATTSWICTNVGRDAALPWAMALHFIGWVAQLVGHFRYESRSPAFTESILHAFLAAPVVIFLEILFSFGLFEDVKTRLARSRVVRRVKNARGSSK